MKLNRRAFLLTAASAARVFGANDRIRLAGIGVGGRGAYDLGVAAKAENTEVVAVSDVYAPRLLEIRGKLAPNGQSYKDYREVLDRKDVDAVIIGTPDHWHVPMIMDAVAAGKDVYCEKPVSHSIEEGEKLLAAVGASKQIVQIGYQQRSWPHYKEARDIFTSGRLSLRRDDTPPRLPTSREARWMPATTVRARHGIQYSRGDSPAPHRNSMYFKPQTGQVNRASTSLCGPTCWPINVRMAGRFSSCT